MNENTKEVMKQWGFHGFFGKIIFYFKFLSNWLKFFLAMKIPIPYYRTQFQRQRGVKIGFDVYLGHDVIIDLLYPNMITIEDFVDIGDRTLIYAHSRGSPPFKKIYPRKIEKVRIGKGTWIGNNAMILPGITIGKYCVIGGSSVVTKDIADFSLAVGSPAKIVRKINKNLLLELNRKKE